MPGECIGVSDDMVVLVGRGAERSIARPRHCLTLAFDLAGQPTLRCSSVDAEADAGADLTLLVSAEACCRLFAAQPLDGIYHLPLSLREIVALVRDCGFEGAARTTYRAAKSIELLCETLMSFESLLPAGDAGIVSLADARRLMAARRMIDEQWRDKLTIDTIARACGLNRVKLTKGFRDLFRTSVAEALAERRLDAARRMLRTTDEPISAIGYRNGYLNNASFARAFGRRFGISPSDYRASASVAA